MWSTYLLAAGFIQETVSAKAGYSRRGVDCDFFATADSGATCESFAAGWGLSVNDLVKLNPDINCPNLDSNKSYCVIAKVNNPPPSTTLPRSTTLKTSTIVGPSTTVKASTTTYQAPSNSQTMPGLAVNCDGFHKISTGDVCDVIAKKYGITTAQFMSWNSGVNADCTNLWLDYYVCVHAPGITPTSQGSSQPTKSPSGPAPQMLGIVSNWKNFYKVKSDDNCWSISNNAKTALDQFLSWNKEVNSNCSNLWLDYFVCIGV